MIIIDTTALLTREVSIERAASEIGFFITVINPWDWDKIGSKLGTKHVKC